MRLRLLSNRFLINKRNIFFCFCLIILLLLIFFLEAYLFRIKTIIIISNNENLEIIGVDLYKNKNLLFVSEKKIEREITDKNPKIKLVIAKKTYPDSLCLTIELNKTIASLKVNFGTFLLAENGRVIAKKKEESQGVPSIKYYQLLDYYSYNAGEIIDFKDLLASLYFIKNISDLGISINTIDINSLSMIALYSEGKNIIVSGKKDWNSQFNQIKTIIKQFKIKGQNFNKLDLRFDKPIVELS